MSTNPWANTDTLSLSEGPDDRVDSDGDGTVQCVNCGEYVVTITDEGLCFNCDALEPTYTGIEDVGDTDSQWKDQHND